MKLSLSIILRIVSPFVAVTAGTNLRADENLLDIPQQAIALSDIPQTAIAAGNFTTLVAALTSAELVATLSSSGPFTVFAPTDAAFGALPDGLVDCLREPKNSGALTKILKYHVIEGEVLSTGLSDGMIAPTLAEEDITVDLTDGVKINDSTVTTPDVGASNGVIHIIDAVLIPPTIDVDAFLATCPEDPAPEVPGANTTLKDIPQTAIAAGGFTTLVAALTSAELVGTLSTTGPFTVFAPTDAAFDDLPDGLVTCLLKPENSGALTTILTYHVIGEEVLSGGLSDGMTTTTLAKEDITVDLTDGVKINDSTVTTPDVLTSNGVIHIIDAVLIPPTINVDAFLATCTEAPAPDDESGSLALEKFTSLIVACVLAVVTFSF